MCCRLSQDRLTRILKHYKENGLSPPEKKSGGRKNNTSSFKFDDIKRVVQFLTSYSEANALLLPGRVPGFKPDDIQLLPSSHTKIIVYTQYKETLDKTSKFIFKFWK
jgi:hypothetical protein